MAFSNADIASAQLAVRLRGKPDDLYRLGLLYSTGQDGEVDYVEAHKWFNLAASRGHEEAKHRRREMADQMTTAQVAAAQRAAREWLDGAGKAQAPRRPALAMAC